MPTLTTLATLTTLFLSLTTASPAFHLRTTSQNSSIQNPYENNLLTVSYQDFGDSGSPFYALVPSNSSTTGTKFHMKTHTLHAQLPVPGAPKKKMSKYSIENLYYGAGVTFAEGKGRSVYLKFNETDQRLTFIPEPMATTNEASWRICDETNGVPTIFLGDGAGTCIPVFITMEEI